LKREDRGGFGNRATGGDIRNQMDGFSIPPLRPATLLRGFGFQALPLQGRGKEPTREYASGLHPHYPDKSAGARMKPRFKLEAGAGIIRTIRIISRAHDRASREFLPPLERDGRGGFSRHGFIAVAARLAGSPNPPGDRIEIADLPFQGK